MFEWIVDFMQDAGYAGIALLMFLENVFPPIPSELIMPLAGYAAADGRLSLAGVIVAGSLGSILSTFIWYEAGRRFGAARLRRWCAWSGRWLGLSPHEVDGAVAWFRRRNGAVAVLFGRLVPGIRTLISIPAGISHMNVGTFLVCSLVGTVLWTTALATVGYLLPTQSNEIEAYLDPISTIIVVVAVAVYVWRVVRWAPPAACDDAAGSDAVPPAERSGGLRD